MKHTILILFAFVAFSCHSQKPIAANGQVLDESNSPIPGASVVQKGTVNGTVTDVNGYFKLKLDSLKKQTLVISFIGYQTVEMKIRKSNLGIIKLSPDYNTLDEIVVTGYHVMRKRIFTGSAMRQVTDTEMNEEVYEHRKETGFVSTLTQPLTTFSADVDRASYSNVRRFINNGNLPPVDAVRIEEMINYFNYDYESPTDKKTPLAFETTLTSSPFNKGLELLRVSLQTERIEVEKLPASNLVFLIDVSGSMYGDDKLELLKKGFKLLVSELREKDRVSIVTYAGSTKCILRSTSGRRKDKILEALDGLRNGGSTAGASGIMLAYEQAEDNFIDGGNNRVIIATDGDFNVGVSSVSDLENLIVKKRESGVFLSVLGFGSGNYKDHQMETLADKGNGNYAYIDNLQEARKVFISEFGGTLFTVAKDVKIQIEFNPAFVQSYRLIGYENRRLNAEDFADDKKDAGELGSGHSMTALYEIVPVGVKSEYVKNTPKLKYQKAVKNSEDYLTLKVRYKEPDGNKSKKMEIPVKKNLLALNEIDDDFRFANAVAAFGLILTESEYKGDVNYSQIIEMAQNGKGNDSEGYRSEFIQLVKLSESIMNTRSTGK